MFCYSRCRTTQSLVKAGKAASNYSILCVTGKTARWGNNRRIYSTVSNLYHIGKRLYYSITSYIAPVLVYLKWHKGDLEIICKKRKRVRKGKVISYPEK